MHVQSQRKGNSMKQAIKVISIVLLVTLLVSSVSGVALAAGVPSGTYVGYTPYNWIYSDWFIRKYGPTHPVAVYDWDLSLIHI